MVIISVPWGKIRNVKSLCFQRLLRLQDDVPLILVVIKPYPKMYNDHSCHKDQANQRNGAK